MLKKIIVLVVIVTICLGVFSACTDYSYEYHFSVIGGNGSISTEGDDPSSVRIWGGKNSSFQIEFTAIPDNGYQVKEWRFNGEIVEGNKSNLFIATAAKNKEYSSTVTVEFEPIS